MSIFDAEVLDRDRNPRRVLALSLLLLAAVVLIPVLGYYLYTITLVNVPTRHIAILTKKTGKDLPNDMEVAPSDEYKGVQLAVLGEQREFYSPYKWDWEIRPQIEVPEGKMGVRIRLYGEELAPGEIIALDEKQKGIVPTTLRPGRYSYNALVIDAERPLPKRSKDNYAELIELHEPITIPAGFKGVVTNLSGPVPKNPNALLVAKGERGVQQETLTPETYYFNPYIKRVHLVDCRSQRFNISDTGDMGFPSKDGFWVSLDGIIEFRVMPDEAAKVFVTYNDEAIDGERVDKEIIDKIILPNARSFCRLRGSNNSGREFISGDTRVQFQKDFQDALERTCEDQGIEIVQALITKIRPPQKIAGPVRDRQIALQEEKQYQRQILQQTSEQELAVEQQLVKRNEALVDADQKVVKTVTDAMRRQEVALIEASQRLKVAEFELKAAEDEAAAVLARGRAAAEVIQFENEAEAAGWRKSVEAFSGDGDEFARWVLMQKLAPAYRRLMVNTADSPIMDIFDLYKEDKAKSAPPE